MLQNISNVKKPEESRSMHLETVDHLDIGMI